MLRNTPEEFARSLREGHFNELRVALYFMLEGAFVRIGYEDHRYDLKVLLPGRPPFSVEVKWDKRAGETGNLYFELENTRQGKPSGVAATQADVWCHVLGQGDEALLVPVDALRSFLEKGHFERRRTRGRDSNSRGMIVPRKALSKLPQASWIRLPSVEDFFGEVFRRASGQKP